MSGLEIIWIVVFILWVAGGVFVSTPNGARYVWGPSVLLAILIAILGWIVFGGIH